MRLRTIFAFLMTSLTGVSLCYGATVAGSSDLQQLAVSRFGPLTAAEQRVLLAASSGTTQWLGPNSNPDDAANDPSASQKWGDDRTVPAEFLAWLVTDPRAHEFVSPDGLTIAGARITGQVHLADREVAFPLTLQNCEVADGIDLSQAHTSSLSFPHTHVGLIDGRRLVTRGDIWMVDGFHASELVTLSRAEVDGELTFGGRLDKGVAALMVNVKGDVVFQEGTVTGQTLDLSLAHINGNLGVYNAQFTGTDQNGLTAWRSIIEGAFYWIDVKMTPNTVLNLTDARVEVLQDDSSCWPAPGNLMIDGLVYGEIEGTKDLAARLDWLGRQPKGYWPQPYSQLAKVFRDDGREADAIDILIAKEDAERNGEDLNQLERAWKLLLKWTIGYGYRSLQALVWMLLFVLLGTLLFGWGHRIGAVVPTENEAHDSYLQHHRLPAGYQPFHALVYSMDTFLPLVELHQEDYWLPNPESAPRRRLPLLRLELNSGAFLRAYLWVHILAGWVLTTLFIAGLSGLVRND